MKKRVIIAALAALSLSATTAFAQQWSWVSGSSGPIKTATGATDVNILNKLNVTGDITTTWGTIYGYNCVLTNDMWLHEINVTADVKTTWGTFRSYNSVVNNDLIVNHDISANAGTVSAYNTLTTNMAVIDGFLRIGNVTTPGSNTNYKLYVEKGILTEKIKVALKSDATNWSDFVFADDYKLPSLSSVEKFVKKNKHLPEIPSAKEVYTNGLDLAEMDAKLLQKIEELTLYVIEQQKEIEQLKKKVK